MKQATVNHSANAAAFIRNNQRMQWHDQSLWYVRSKRDRMAKSLPEWEELRSLAANIKEYVVANLPDLLEQFEQQAKALGAVVHWATNATEHNAIILEILRKHRATYVVKSKSMLTEECHLNPFLERQGIRIIDTDLGERIVQLREEVPSHIVLPAIHIKKEEVGDLFHRHLGTESGASDPQYLTEAARQHLRGAFLRAEVGITGVNFAIAETGGIVVCTNEGNADLGTSLPPVHIACMGLEKLLPRFADLSVFTRLLARSATGQPITTYTSHFHGPRPGCELHLVIVDNGRSLIRDSESLRPALGCIRCGACMNTCPVYRRSGGHSYGSVVPGPIGSVLNPAADAPQFRSLPYACSLCGSCTDVCPVKIPLHHQLLAWRKEVAGRGLLSPMKVWPMRVASWVFQRPKLFAVLGRIAKSCLRIMPRWMLYHRWNAWGRDRELPPAPQKSFRQWWEQRSQAKHDNGST
jgi:L-lactate dehydrogenase complex protein LldF